MVTSAPRPVAMRAALTPDVPPPTTTTRPGKTPGTPPSKTPLPPLYLARKLAPITTDIRPAISLIGSNSGKRLLTWIVSYATAVTPDFSNASVRGLLAARCKYVNKIWRSEERRVGKEGGGR